MTANENTIQINENLTLIQNKNGLTFGTDAYLLAAYLKGGAKKRAADLGSGTGIISLLCQAKSKFSHIYAVEIQECFATLIEKNAEQNNLSDKISVINSDLRDLHSSDTDGELDCVFANPPYMKADSGKRNQHDEKYIARHEVHGTIDDFCVCARKLLKHGGKFYCVWRPDRLSELMTAMSAHRLEPKTMVFVHADENSEPSVALISATKGGAPAMRILPPLLLHSADSRGESARQLSERAQRIYETMSFYD